MTKLAEQITKNFPFTYSSLKELQSEEELLIILSQYVQELIDTDFAKLINTLYRIDVSEVKIKRALDLSKPKDANKIIAQLIIEREKQKNKTREEYNNDSK
jgi:hypothetical protein